MNDPGHPPAGAVIPARARACPGGCQHHIEPRQGWGRRGAPREAPATGQAVRANGTALPGRERATS